MNVGLDFEEGRAVFEDYLAADGGLYIVSTQYIISFNSFVEVKGFSRTESTYELDYFAT